MNLCIGLIREHQNRLLKLEEGLLLVTMEICVEEKHHKSFTDLQSRVFRQGCELVCHGAKRWLGSE